MERKWRTKLVNGEAERKNSERMRNWKYNKEMERERKWRENEKMKRK